MSAVESLEERLDRLYIPEPNSGCWLPVNKLNADGYCRVSVGRAKQVNAHRLSYTASFGAIPAGFEVDHLCRNRACGNPAHLEAVPKPVNIRRGMAPVMVAHRENVCVRGLHALEGSNLVVRKDGKRACRACLNARVADRRRKRFSSDDTARLARNAYQLDWRRRRSN